jgi:hypothetical protein
MSNPLSVEPAKSANNKDKSFSKKLRETDETAASAGSGNSKRTMSSRYWHVFKSNCGFYYPHLVIVLINWCYMLLVVPSVKITVPRALAM